jgi:site-specific DNA-cytosine methylase
METNGINYPVIGIINAGGGGEARTIKSQYFKNSAANFLRQNGFSATGVILINDMTKTLCALGYTRDKHGIVTEYHPIENANTVHSHTGSGSNTDQFILQEENMANPPYRIRRFTPVEVCRIMGIKDEDAVKLLATRIVTLANGETREKRLLSDTAIYQRCGNSICIPVMVEIFSKIFK